MFTGIIEDVGKVLDPGPTLKVATALGPLELGSSIAVNGVCLTVTSWGGDAFAADLSEETLDRTTLGRLRSGRAVNLERPMSAMGRFGGHIVQGHVDGRGQVAALLHRDASTEVKVAVPDELMKWIVVKGSVAIDGVSLTVASTDEEGFTVSLIPHTLSMTNLSDWEPGTPLNIEVDIIAKYVQHLIGGYLPPNG